jgi:hypothetical protein
MYPLPEGIMMSPVISAVPGLRTWRARLLIAAVALVAGAGALFASPGVARADVLYNGIYRNWQSGNCLDSNWSGSAYSIPCNGGNFQNWSIDHVDALNDYYFGFKIIDDETGMCLDTNSSALYTHSCVTGDPNQIWWMYGLDDTHQIWVNKAFTTVLWDNGNGGGLGMANVSPYNLENGLGIWKPGF